MWFCETLSRRLRWAKLGVVEGWKWIGRGSVVIERLGWWFPWLYGVIVWWSVGAFKGAFL